MIFQKRYKLSDNLLFSLTPKEFNSYGSRRGNDAIMVRGTFANIRLVNKFIGKPGPRTLYIPNKEEVRLPFHLFMFLPSNMDYQYFRWTFSMRRKNIQRMAHR